MLVKDSSLHRKYNGQSEENRADSKYTVGYSCSFKGREKSCYHVDRQMIPPLGKCRLGVDFVLGDNFEDGKLTTCFGNWSYLSK